MNMRIMCKVSSGKNNNEKNNSLTKPITHKVRDVLLENLLGSTPTHSKEILSKQEIFSHSSACQESTKSLYSIYATNSSCHRLRGKSKENINNLDTKNQGIQRSTANDMLGHTIFNDCSSGVFNENYTNCQGKKLDDGWYPRYEQAPVFLLSCNSMSGNGLKKSLQRRSEERIMEEAMPINANVGPDNAHAVADAAKSNLATSALLSNKPRQSSGHHKTKCRSSVACRSQFKFKPVIAAGAATVDATKHLSNIPLPRKISTKTERVPGLKKAQVVPTFAGALSDVPIFPQAWQQFLKLLRNSVAGISSPSRLSKESVKTTPTIARNTAKNVESVYGVQEQSRTSARTLTAAEASAAAARCKAAAAAISSVHSSGSSSSRTKFRLLPSLGATSFFTLLTLVCLETVLLSTVSNCAKTFYMHWNTSNSIFRIDNTDHIIDVNKGNLAFEFDQVHIICPVYEPGTFENETEKYIIYNVSKVEYETCRITNADPRVIAICDKPQKLMFFTITFRPFTPQPDGLEFLPGNDYYFISTSSKDDLYRRIGGRCSTNNMKVVFKVCCAPEEKNKTSMIAGSGSGTSSGGGKSAGGINSADGSGMTTGIDSSGNLDVGNTQNNMNQHQHMNNINTIGINGFNTGLMPIGGVNIGVTGGVGANNGGMQMKPMNGASGTSINTNIDQFNRIPMQAGGTNVMGNNIGGIGGIGLGGHNGGIMLTPGGHGGINMISSGGNIGIGQYPGHPGQTGIRINNVASQQHHATHKNNNNNGKDAGTGEVGVSDGVSLDGSLLNINFGDAQFLPPFVNTNQSNIVQSTIKWPGWGRGGTIHSINHSITTTTRNGHNINEQNNNYYSPSHRPINNKTSNKNDHYDKHPNEVVKNEELTYHSGAASIHPWPAWKAIGTAVSSPFVHIFGWLFSRSDAPTSMTSATATRLCNSCHKNQRYLSQQFESAVFSRERKSQPFLTSFVKFKSLIFNYKQLVFCSIAIVAVTIYVLKFSVISTKLPCTAATVANSSSSAKNAIVPHLLLDTFDSDVTQKPTLIELSCAFVSPIAYASLGLTSLSEQGHKSANASASISSASSSTQYFVAVWSADKTKSNIVLSDFVCNPILIKYCRSQIYSVSVKVKRFR